MTIDKRVEMEGRLEGRNFEQLFRDYFPPLMAFARKNLPKGRKLVRADFQLDSCTVRHEEEK